MTEVVKFHRQIGLLYEIYVYMCKNITNNSIIQNYIIEENIQ